MKVFLARWPDHKVSLLGAQRPGDVFDHLHDEGDPSLCSVEPYNKPFCLTFAPSVPPENDKKKNYDPFPAVPDSSMNLASDLSALLSDDSLADVTFHIESKEIHCHKAILAARSSYFKAMFSSGMRESNKRDVNVSESSFHTFNLFIEFLYTGNFTEPTENVLRDCSLGQESDKEIITDASSEESKSPRTTKEERTSSIDELKFDFLLSMLNLADFYGCQSLLDKLQVDIATHCVNYLSENNLVKAYNAATRVHNASILLDYLPYLIERALFREQISEETFLKVFSSEVQEKIHNYHEHIRGSAPFVFGPDKKLRIILNAMQFSLSQIKQLIEDNEVNLNRVRALHMTLEFWDTDGENSCDDDVVRACELFLEREADPNLTDKCGNTPLHLAAKYLAEPLVYRLLNAGACPDRRNTNGKTYWDLIGDAEKVKAAEEAACLFDSQLFLYEQRISYSLETVRQIKERVQRDAMDRGIWHLLEDPTLEDLEPDYGTMGIKINDQFYEQFLENESLCSPKRVHFNLYFMCPGVSFGGLFDDLLRCAFPNVHEEYHDMVRMSLDDPSAKLDTKDIKWDMEDRLFQDIIDAKSNDTLDSDQVQAELFSPSGIRLVHRQFSPVSGGYNFPIRTGH